MSGTLNKVMLIGHLGDDVKMHYFDDKNCVGRFPLATNETYVSKQSNERVSNTEWHNIVVRNKGAEICEKYLSKGDRIYVEGRIKTRKWQDENGNDKFSTEIQCTDFKFLSTKKESEGGSFNQTITSKPENNGHSVNEPITDDDDLPF